MLIQLKAYLMPPQQIIDNPREKPPADGAKKVVVVSDSSFSSIVKGVERTTFIKFTATWCGPCKRIAPEFKRLATEYPENAFVEVDVDECTELSRKFGITAMPTFVAYSEKTDVLEVVRGANPATLERLVKNHF